VLSTSKKYFILLLTFISLWHLSTYAQIDRQQAIGAYVYNFANTIEWPNEKNISEFSIVLISNNQQLID